MKNSNSDERNRIRRKMSSEFIMIVGLLLSSVFDPASKVRIEAIDSKRKRKVDPGRENQ